VTQCVEWYLCVSTHIVDVVSFMFLTIVCFLMLLIHMKRGDENIWTKEGGSNRRMEKMHNEELHNLYTSVNIVRVTK
jgi:hypothetical protein